MMTYNPPYYAKLLENFGLKKEKDLFAYYLSHDKYCSEKMERVNKLLQERHSFSIRTMNMKKFHKDLELVKRIYNAGWSRNWGAVPLTDEEIEVLAADLKSVVDPDLVLFIEKDGEAIGFALKLPDVNIALKHNKSGWLLPGLFYLWKYKKKINFVRIIVLGVIPEYLNSGAGGLLLYETGKRSVAKGYIYGEASWVLEDNVRMVRAAETMKGEPYKKYRIYQIPI